MSAFHAELGVRRRCNSTARLHRIHHGLRHRDARAQPHAHTRRPAFMAGPRSSRLLANHSEEPGKTNDRAGPYDYHLLLGRLSAIAFLVAPGNGIQCGPPSQLKVTMIAVPGRVNQTVALL